MSLEALRDEFAAMALAGLIVSQPREIPLNREDLARLAYWIADQMLVQRRAYCPACQQMIDSERGFIVHESGCTYGWQAEAPTGVEL